MNALPALLCSTLLLAALPVHAQPVCTDPVDPSGVHLQQQQQNGIAYLSGGIGIDESCAIQQTHGYNLRLTFSVGTDNKYDSGAKVSIRTAQGKELLSLDDVGPVLLVQLPAGKYVVVAQLNGHEWRNNFDVKNNKTLALNAHWGS